MKPVWEQIKEQKIVGIIRTSTVEKAIKAVDALVEGGFKILELTFTIPQVEIAIEYAIKKYQNQVVIGCGTILTVEQAKIAQKLGCQFLVAPNTDEKINEFCQQKNLLYLPGAMTVNEIAKALAMGRKAVKLFPANAFSWKYIASIKTVFPNLQVMATGGVNEENILDCFKAGVEVCGVGGNLIAPIEKEDDYAKAVTLAKKYLEKVKA